MLLRVASYYRLSPRIQNYDWGNPDPKGLIPTLARGSGVDPGAGPFAELWMGGHPSLPSTITHADRFRVDPPVGLDQAVSASPEHFLGRSLASSKKLPFLFKVLDAGKPLSIQAHPDTALANILHARDPEHYPDPFHKPELAVSIRDMTALVGFRTRAAIAEDLKDYPELETRTLTESGRAQGENRGTTDGDSLDERDWIRFRYTNIMRMSREDAGTLTRSMLTHPGSSPRDQLFRMLVEMFGDDDPGLFSAYFLNHIRLAPGEGIFLGPNEPHAYLGGQILECMAASDNVVRAGLTRKFCDVETLVSMLHYRSGAPEILRARADGSDRKVYPVPVNEFETAVLTLRGGTLPTIPSGRPSIQIVGEGNLRWDGADAPPGTVILIPANPAGPVPAWEGTGIVYEAASGKLV